MNGVFAGQGTSRGLTTATRTCCEGLPERGIRRSEPLCGPGETATLHPGEGPAPMAYVPFCRFRSRETELLRSTGDHPYGAVPAQSGIDHRGPFEGIPELITAGPAGDMRAAHDRQMN